MSSNTKIVVLRSKEIVYALVLLVVSVLIIMVAVSLFLPAKDSASPVPAQNAEESMEQAPSQVPSQTPSRTAPETTPADRPQNNTQNGTQNNTSNGTQSGTSGGTRNSISCASAAQVAYIPGIYSSTLLLGNATIELQIAVDKNHINSITLTNLDESVTTLYPLMSPTLSELATTILSEQSIDNISYGTENRYTSMLLMQAISEALDKAAASENADRPESSVIY